jgi:hypothetical protein
MKTLFRTIVYKDFVFEVEYTYTPMIPGKLTGPPEDCYPDEPAELEFISVCLAFNSVNLLDILSEETISALEEELLNYHQAGGL